MQPVSCRATAFSVSQATTFWQPARWRSPPLPCKSIVRRSPRLAHEVPDGGHLPVLRAMVPAVILAGVRAAPPRRLERQRRGPVHEWVHKLFAIEHVREGLAEGHRRHAVVVVRGEVAPWPQRKKRRPPRAPVPQAGEQGW